MLLNIMDRNVQLMDGKIVGILNTKYLAMESMR